jgi:outer membrane biosynthesis protein TonB
MEAGVPFVEYRSADVPATARKSYDTDLRKAGFAEVDTQAGWTVYGKDDVVLWVFVGESGPPTTIIVRYAQGDEAATILATAAAGTPGTTEPDGTPGPSGAPVVTAANPTPEPATRPTAPDRTPPGQGNKPTARPTAEPTAKPTAKPKPTAEPTAKPKPTKKPKPTHKPKPTKKPKPTPSPANGGGKGNKP